MFVYAYLFPICLGFTSLHNVFSISHSLSVNVAGLVVQMFINNSLLDSKSGNYNLAEVFSVHFFHISCRPGVCVLFNQLELCGNNSENVYYILFAWC